MAIQTSGQIAISDIVNEFGGSAPHAMSEYYSAAAGIPASGMISVSDFYGASAALSLTVTSSQLNFDFYDALISAGNSSSAISGVQVFNLTINSGVTMKGSNTGGSNVRLGEYSYNTSYSVTDHGDTAAGAFGVPKVPMGPINSRAGTSIGGITIEGLPNSATINIVNNGTIEPGAGSGGHGPWNNHGPWHSIYQHCGGGTGGSGILVIDQDSCTINFTNNGTVRGAGGGGGGGGWGAGHSSCCPKWGGDGQGHNRSNQGGAGGSHGGNSGASGGSWGNGGGSSGNSPGGLGGTVVELRSCSGTSVNFTNNGTSSSAGTTRSTSSWRA